MHCESTRVESRYGGKGGGADGASQVLDDRGVTGLKYHHHSRLVLALMWTASLVLLPILLWQGHRTRQMALRLPEAESPDSGQFGTGESEISIVGLGDSVIAGIGIRANEALAKDCGLICENGIVVNKYCQTSDPDIFAIGDCSKHPNNILGRMIRLESVQNAVEQASSLSSFIVDPTKSFFSSSSLF